MDDLPLDLSGVAAWMSREGLGDGPIGDVSVIVGGTQNVMLRFSRAGRDYVLRRGPQHLRPVSNSVILRETRVLRALAGTDVPHPALIAVCEDISILGDAVFYLMEPVEGFNAGSEMPELHASNAAVRHEMGLSMAAAVARLGAVDHVAVGLADFGKPTGFLERQVPRWLSELESYAKFENYPGPDIGDVGGVTAWLRQHQPADFSPGIMHGDYHAANVMFSRSGPELVAIVDWEMCTIGDPLLDLGWMLVCWPIAPNPLGSAGYLAELGGLARRGELLEAYQAAGGRRTEQLDWYLALACLKLGVVIEGTWARYLAGAASREAGQRLHDGAVLLMSLGTAVAAGDNPFD